MVQILDLSDLPAAVQSSELVDLMIQAANAKASRVAPCLTAPTTAWAAVTAYTAGQTIVLPGGEALRVVTGGTSGATAPTAPDLDATVTDSGVTWQRIGPTNDILAEARLILVGAVKRWSEAGSGAITQQMTTTGPYSHMETIDTKQRAGYNLWPSEITQLQELCKTGGTGKAFTVDTAPGLCNAHVPWCSLNMGATFCSCGADIAGEPIYEVC